MFQVRATKDCPLLHCPLVAHRAVHDRAVTANIFLQAFRCRTLKQSSRSGHGTQGLGPEQCKEDELEIAESDGLGGLESHKGRATASITARLELAPQGDARSAQSFSRKRQKMSYKLLRRDMTAVVKAEPLDQPVDIDRLGAVATADETVYTEDVERLVAVAVLSGISRRARGREGIDLDNARGLPERLGDRPLRLVIGGNNPSDHAW